MLRLFIQFRSFVIRPIDWLLYQQIKQYDLHALYPLLLVPYRMDNLLY
jgi:hypothetical protein